jgi:MFS family permease
MPHRKYINLHYAWVVLAVTFVCLLVSAAIRSVPGIIILSLEHEFHWSRETISGALSVNLLLNGLVGPFLGRQMDKHGTKTITLFMILLLTIGAAGSTFMTEPWQLYLLWGLIVGVGSGGLSVVLGACIVNRWFNEHRGLAMGILGAAFSSGQLIFTPVIMNLNIHFGWQTVLHFIVLLFSCLVLPLVLWLMVDNPAEKGIEPYGN